MVARRIGERVPRCRRGRADERDGDDGRGRGRDRGDRLREGLHWGERVGAKTVAIGSGGGRCHWLRDTIQENGRKRDAEIANGWRKSLDWLRVGC